MYYQSKIIVSKNLEDEEILKHLNFKIENQNFYKFQGENNSIGINEINEFISKSFSRSVGNIQVFLIKESQKLTTEAQNSLLKVLEEPIKNTLILLQTDNPDTLIETIKSRCEIIYLNAISEKTDENSVEILFKDFLNINYLEKLSVSERFLKDNNSKSSIKNAILIILDQIAKKQLHVDSVNVIQKAYKAVDLNVSPKLIFDTIILSLS